MAYSRPIQVFTEAKTKRLRPFEAVPDTNIKMEENLIKDSTSVSMLNRQITVSGVGEMMLPPDLFSLTITCKASKDNIQDAKTSVTRRVDYIIQTLNNHSLSEDQYTVYTHAGHSDTHAQYETEIEAHFTEVSKCLRVSNLLAEKLGPGVTLCLPTCFHGQGSIDRVRKQASMLAIYNARQKAMEMTKIIHMSIGAAIKVQEVESEETHGTPMSESDSFDANSSIQQKIAEKTIKVCSKVNVSFQLKAGKPKKL